jgi:hypothetical protein
MLIARMSVFCSPDCWVVEVTPEDIAIGMKPAFLKQNLHIQSYTDAVG